MTNRKQNNPEVTRDRWDIYRFARWFVNDCNKKLLSSTSKRCIAGVKLHYKWCMVMRQTSTSLEGNSFTEKGCVWIKREFLRRSIEWESWLSRQRVLWTGTEDSRRILIRPTQQNPLPRTGHWANAMSLAKVLALNYESLDKRASIGATSISAKRSVNEKPQSELDYVWVSGWRSIIH